MLELHYPMIQFLIINLSNFFGEKNENEAFRGSVENTRKNFNLNIVLVLVLVRFSSSNLKLSNVTHFYIGKEFFNETLY